MQMIIEWSGQTMPALPLGRELEVVAQAAADELELLSPSLGSFLAHQSRRGLAARLTRGSWRRWHCAASSTSTFASTPTWQGFKRIANGCRNSRRPSAARLSS